MIANHQYKPVLYFLMTFFATYTLWFAGAYVSFQEDINHLYMLLMLPGLMAPFLISVVMIWTSDNAGLKKDFIDRLVNPRLIRLETLPTFVFIMPLS